MSAVEEMKVTALAPWKGSNRMNAHRVGELLRGCEWVGVVFAGGMSEVPHIKARTILVNDLHRHIINLAKVVAHDASRNKLIGRLADFAFHPDELQAAQDWCRMFPPGSNGPADVQAAEAYFVTQWMGRSGEAGTEKEFTGKIPIRWNAGGGDSNVRYRSAVESLAAWGDAMRRCTFSTLDFREFLSNCHDKPKHGIYSDAPFPTGGEKYVHKFTEQDHIDLRDHLARFKESQVVVRYYDHPLIRELYAGWKWIEFTGRKQSNADAPEVLVTNEGLV